jgi:hypothetical protein
LKFFDEKGNQDRKRRAPSPLKLQMALEQLCKDMLTYLCKHPNIQLLKGRIDQWGVGHVGHDNPFLWLELHQR